LNPFAFDVFPIRLGTGVVVTAGKIHYYPHVPVGASISRDEIYDGKYPLAGTLGCYLKLKDGSKKYALTAGHVVRDSPSETHDKVYAPAFTPFLKARQTIKLALDDALPKFPNAPKIAELRKMPKALDNLHREFADIVFASQATEATPRTTKKTLHFLKLYHIVARTISFVVFKSTVRKTILMMVVPTSLLPSHPHRLDSQLQKLESVLDILREKSLMIPTSAFIRA
jgi:hypothetical protein